MVLKIFNQVSWFCHILLFSLLQQFFSCLFMIIWVLSTSCSLFWTFALVISLACMFIIVYVHYLVSNHGLLRPRSHRISCKARGCCLFRWSYCFFTSIYVISQTQWPTRGPSHETSPTSEFQTSYIFFLVWILLFPLKLTKALSLRFLSFFCS